MRTPEDIYQWLVASPNRVMAAAILTDDELLRVSGWLAQRYDENETSGEMLGICLVERSERWAHELMRTKEDRKAGGAE